MRQDIILRSEKYPMTTKKGQPYDQADKESKMDRGKKPGSDDTTELLKRILNTMLPVTNSNQLFKSVCFKSIC